MRKKLQKLAPFLFLILAGCKPPEMKVAETKVSGQIFVVTEGAENFKLGDVEVFLIEKPPTSNFLNAKAVQIESKIKSLESDVSKEEKEVMSARVDNDLFVSEWMSNSAANHENLNSTEAAQKGQEKAERLRLAYSRLDFAKAKMNGFPAYGDYLASFSPNIYQRTRTDADGRFTFVYPSEKSLVIFAMGQRRLPEKTEDYFWMLSAPTNAVETNIIMSNDNLAENDPDNFFRIKLKPNSLNSSEQ